VIILFGKTFGGGSHGYMINMKGKYRTSYGESPGPAIDVFGYFYWSRHSEIAFRMDQDVDKVDIVIWICFDVFFFV